jgi:hypothetical protein
MEVKAMRIRKNFGRGTILFLILIMISLMVSIANANLIALWKFEEATGDSNIFDETTFNNDGKLYAGPIDSTFTTTKPYRINNVHGKIGNHGLEFGCPGQGVIPTASGTTRNWNYAAVPTNNVLKQLGIKWTIAFWYKQYTNDPAVHYAAGGGSGYQRIVSSPEYEIEAGVPSDAQDYFWPYDTPVWEMGIGSCPTLNTWHHFALTYDGTTLTRYSDGTAIFSTTVSNQQLPVDKWGSEALTFAVQTYPLKDFFIGALDEVAIFNECLDATEVATIKGGNFAGPWELTTYETDQPITYVWDPSFIAQKDTIVLNPGSKAQGVIPGVPSWNWCVEGDTSNLAYFGLVNAAAIDGDPTSYEYAAYTTVGTNVYQKILWKKIHKDHKYDFRVRFAGENAVGNIVGVKFYAVDPNREDDDPNKVLLVNMSQTITANAQWVQLSTTYTATSDPTIDNKRFKVVCYVEQGSGGARGTAFGWFDYVRIDVNDLLTCGAIYEYHGNDPCLPYDINRDCRMDFVDFAAFADTWMTDIDPEPSTSSTELLVNNDFTANKASVPNAGDNDEITPTGWTFVPSTFDTNEAGIWNVSQMGTVGSPVVIQPAGGSVAAYIDPNVELRQAVTSKTIVSGQTYYLSAMLGGVAYSYQNVLKVTYEYIDNPTSPTTVVQIAVQDYNTLPDNTGWRRFCNVWTAPAGAAGKYFRVRAEYGPPAISGFTPAHMGWGLIGDISIDTVKPAYWYRSNLLTNGDFEDVSNLPMGDLSATDGWLRLVGTSNGWNWNFGYPSYVYPPGWTFYEDYELGGTNITEGGLQCMLWAPSPQPAHGHGISAVLGHDISDVDIVEIEQKITSETIQAGQTYYVDFIGCIAAANYNNGTWQWPTPDPNIVLNVYWLAAGQNDIHSGTENVNWGLITSLKKPADNGMGANGGHWQIGSTSFTATSTMAGKSMYVVAYGEVPYTTFDEIYVSKEPLQTINPYTCADALASGDSLSSDYNRDCLVNFKDINMFVIDWLECNDPAGCN